MFEYKVIPAPRKAAKAKGVKGQDNRFAYAFEETLNEMGADGWEYVRAESLPVDERHGLTRKRVEEFHNLLVFRRKVIPEAVATPQDDPVVEPLFAEKSDPEVTKSDRKKTAQAASEDKEQPKVRKPELKAEK